MKPWQVATSTAGQDSQSERIEIPAGVPRDGHIDMVDGDEGSTHFRTRPGEGHTPPGAGRPGGRSADNTPVNYAVRTIEQEEYGVRDNEELYAPPAPVEPKNPQRPMLPEEFEAVWQQRALDRQAQAQKGAVINTEAFMRPGQPVTSTVGRQIVTECPDYVIAQLEERIRSRKAEMAREKEMQAAADRIDAELRIVRVDGVTSFVYISGGNLTVLSKIAAEAVIGKLLS